MRVQNLDSNLLYCLSCRLYRDIQPLWVIRKLFEGWSHRCIFVYHEIWYIGRSNSSNTNTLSDKHSYSIIKSSERAEISPYLKPASQFATVSWMLVEGTRLLGQRPGTIYYSKSPAYE